MARILAAMATLLFLLPVPGATQEIMFETLTETDRVAIRQVIESQLSALQHDDAALAFSFASPMIRQKFGSAEDFLDMVRTAYPPVYRPRDTEFRRLDMTWDGPVQEVFFFGPDGEPAVGYYLMEQQPDGSWKINGCRLAGVAAIGI